MSDREALAAAIALYRNRAFVVLEVSPELLTIVETAEEHLAQLPETCGTCIETPGTVDVVAGFADCPSCHGRGTVYPPALVERIAKVLYRRYPLEPVSMNRDAAVAVLDTLNTEAL